VEADAGERRALRCGKLTALAVTQAKRRSYYGDGGGLFLQVSASEAKSWVFRFKEAGKLREMGLGATHTMSLAEARQKALECRKARLDGAMSSTASERVIECATVKAVTTFTTDHNRRAHSTTAARKAMWS
jgi:Arm DNA-binding domain